MEGEDVVSPLSTCVVHLSSLRRWVGVARVEVVQLLQVLCAVVRVQPLPHSGPHLGRPHAPPRHRRHAAAKQRHGLVNTCGVQLARDRPTLHSLAIHPPHPAVASPHSICAAAFPASAPPPPLPSLPRLSLSARPAQRSPPRREQGAHSARGRSRLCPEHLVRHRSALCCCPPLSACVGMGCGASHPVDPLDAPLASRDTRSSTTAAPAVTTPKADSSSDNPLLDPSPPLSNRKASLPSNLSSDPSPPAPPSSEPRTSDVTPLPTHNRHVSRVVTDDDDDDEQPSPTRAKRPPSASARPPSATTRPASAVIRPASATARNSPTNHSHPPKAIDEEKTATDDDDPPSPHEPIISPTPTAAKNGTTSSLPPPPFLKSSSFTELLSIQPPSMLLCDPTRLTTALPSTFLHYAKKLYEPSSTNPSRPISPPTPQHDADEEKLDKKAVHQLAYDCVLSFMSALKKDTAKMKEAGRKKEEEYLRRKFLPGDTVEECMDTAVGYLKAELIYKNGCVTKTCFFFHFPRAYRCMFVYEKMTLEREALVVKWNKACREAVAKKEKEAAQADKSTLEGDKKKDKKKSKKKKDRKTAPAGGDMFSHMAGHGSKLLQAERKVKMSTRNLLKDVPKDDDDE